MIRRPPRSTLSSSSAASDVYKRQRHGTNRQVMAVVHGLSSSRAAGSTSLSSRHRKFVGGNWLPPGSTSWAFRPEPTRLLSISYAVFCLKKKKQARPQTLLSTKHRNT